MRRRMEPTTFTRLILTECLVKKWNFYKSESKRKQSCVLNYGNWYQSMTSVHGARKFSFSSRSTRLMEKISLSPRSMIPKDRKSRSRLESWKMHLAMLCLTPPGDPSHFIPLIAYVPAFLSHHLTLMVVPWWLSDTYFNLVQVKDSAAGKSHLASCSTKNAVQTPCSLCALHSCLLLQSLQTHALLVNLIDGRGVVGRHHWFKNCKWFLLHHSSLGKPSWKHCYYQFKH